MGRNSDEDYEPSYYDDEEEILNNINEGDKLPRFLLFLRWFQHWPLFAKTLIYVILGDFVLMIPVVIDYFFFVQNPSDGFFSFQSSASIGGKPMMYWFILLAITWSIFFVTSWVCVALPVVALRFINFILGKHYAAITRPKLEYLQHLRFYVSGIIASLILYILTAVFLSYELGNVSSADYRFTLNRVLLSIFLGSICLFLEKLILQIVAVGFHRTAYAERIVRTKFTDYVLEQLHQAVRRKRKMRGLQSNETSPNSYRGLWPFTRNTRTRTVENEQQALERFEMVGVSLDDSNVHKRTQQPGKENIE